MNNCSVILALVQTSFQLILGGIMLGLGSDTICNNGATDYLFTGGAIIVATHILPFIMAIVICVAVSNKSYEDCIDKTLLSIQLRLSLVSFGVTIWVGKVLHRDRDRDQVILNVRELVSYPGDLITILTIENLNS